MKHFRKPIFLLVLFALVIAVSLLVTKVVYAAAMAGQADPPPVDWGADFVLAIISAGLSLAFAYLPVLKDLYDRMDSRSKPLVMLGLITVIVFGRLAVVSHFDWTLIQAGLGETAALWLACLVANSQTYEKFVRQQKQAKALAPTSGTFATYKTYLPSDKAKL